MAVVIDSVINLIPWPVGGDDVVLSWLDVTDIDKTASSHPPSRRILRGSVGGKVVEIFATLIGTKYIFSALKSEL
jgi:hypothetical protein